MALMMSVVEHVFFAVDGQNNNLARYSAPPEFLHYLEAVHTGHVNIQDGDVRPQLFDLSERLFSVSRLRDHTQALLRLDHRPQPLTKDRGRRRSSTAQS